MLPWQMLRMLRLSWRAVPLRALPIHACCRMEKAVPDFSSTEAGVWDWTPDRLLLPSAAAHAMAGQEIPAGHNPYERENEAFIHALRTGDRTRILSDYADACRTQEITTAALASADSGLPVQLKPIKNLSH